MDVALIFALPRIQNKNINTPIRQKELMSSMHDFLAAEVPEVYLHVLIFCPSRYTPTLVNIDSLRLILLWVEGVIDYPPHQGGLSDASLSNEDHLYFVECAFADPPHLKVVAQNLRRQSLGPKLAK